MHPSSYELESSVLFRALPSCGLPSDPESIVPAIPVMKGKNGFTWCEFWSLSLLFLTLEQGLKQKASKRALYPFLRLKIHDAMDKATGKPGFFLMLLAPPLGPMARQGQDPAGQEPPQWA